MNGQPDMTIAADTELLLGYLDGALSDQQRSMLEARLATDAELAAQLDELRELGDQFVALAGRDVMPTQREDQIIWRTAAMMRQPVRARWLSKVGRIAAVAAALLVATTVGYFAGSQTKSRLGSGDSPLAEVSSNRGATDSTGSWRPVLASGELRLVDTGPGQTDAIETGTVLTWGLAMVANQPVEIRLSESSRLGLDGGAVVRLLEPAEDRPLVEISGGRWHLAGSDLAGAVVVADGGTLLAESAELELVSEPAEVVNGGGTGPTGVALAVFAGVVTVSNPSGQITLGAGEMAIASVETTPAKRVWEPSVTAYVDALTQWYALNPAQQHEVGQLLTELRHEQEWLFAPHEQELDELRDKLGEFWLTALQDRPKDTREYLEDYAKYRELQAESPYRLQSILERVEAMLPASQLSRAWADMDQDEHLVSEAGVARRLGVSDSMLAYVGKRYRLTDEQMVQLEQYVRANRPAGQAGQTTFDELLAAVAEIASPEQVRRANHQAGVAYRHRISKRQVMLEQLLPELDWRQPSSWSTAAQQYARQCRLTPAQTDHARQAADEIATLAQSYYQSQAEALRSLDTLSEPQQAQLVRPLQAWADQLRQKLAALPTLEQLELAIEPDAQF